MKKKIISAALSLALILSVLPAGALAAETGFDDVKESDWYCEDVTAAASAGLMQGEGGGRFDPTGKMSRAMLAQVLYRLGGSEKASGSVSFSDVAADAWYADAVNWAAATGITNGCGDGTFAPEENVTRQQLAAFFKRFAAFMGRDTLDSAAISSFADASAVADWAQGDMRWAVYTGLIGGTDENKLEPEAPAERAQVASILMRYIKGDTLEKRSLDYVSQFADGSFTGFYDDSHESFKAVIPYEMLPTQWGGLVQGIGEPKGFTCSYSRIGGYDVTVVTAECTLYRMTVTMTYNADGQPVGLNLGVLPNTPPLAQSTDKWEEIPVAVGEWQLPGFLTLPKNVEKPAVVIMIQGSGSSDMNESLGTAPNRPFEDIARGLAEQGIATLRYNKRTYQYPQGNNFTIQAEIFEDAASAVKMLAADSRVDAERIYVLGHSLGGMMAPKITADNPQIKGFISLAGTLRKLQDVMLDQNKAFYDANTTLTSEEKAAAYAQIVAEVEKMQDIKDGDMSIIMGAPAQYWKSLNDVDGPAILKTLKVPMLIMQGSEDFQVYADKDFELWKTELAGNPNAQFKLYDGLSHLFMTNQISETGAADVSYYNAPNHVAPEVMRDIAQWLKGLK